MKRHLSRLFAATVLLLSLAGPSVAHASANPFALRPAKALNPFGGISAQVAQNTNPPRTAASTPVACVSDEQCPDQTICTDGFCRVLERPVHVLLFRKDGPITAFWPFYFSRTGTPGYRVVAPLYWHFWSSEEKDQIFAPFYFHFRNYLKQSRTTALWVGPVITWSRQPGASSWGVWPIVYSSTKFGWAAPLLGSFNLKDPEAGREKGLAAFVYYWSRDQKAGRATDVLFPLVWSFRSKEKSFTVGFPVLWSWRKGRDETTLLLPLGFQTADARSKLTVSWFGYSSWAGNNQRGSHLWVYWYGRNKGKDDYDVLFPLLWSFRKDQDNATVLFPLLWHFADAQSRATVVATYIAYRNAEGGFRCLLPVFFQGWNNKEKSSWSLLFPLAFWSKKDNGNKLSVYTPVGGYERDKKANTSGLTLLLPPIFTRHSAQRDFQMAFPFYYRSDDRVAQSHALLAGLYYQSKDPEGTTATLFPFFWRFKDTQNGATATALLPFFFNRSAPDDHLTALGFGLWGYYRNRGTHGGSAGLAPLLFFGRHDDDRHAVVFPLLWHFSSPNKSSTLALPLFGHWRDKDQRHTAVFPLLYFAGGNKQTSYAFQVPLFWRFTNHEANTATTVVGPAFYRSRPQGWSAGLFPLVFAGNGSDRSHVVVAPLLWHFRDKLKDTSSTLVGPYFHATNGGETTDALFPLVYYRRGAKPGGRAETSFTLFPLLHYKRTADTKLFVSPLAMSKTTPTRQAGFIGPYFWYNSATTSVRGALPVWFDVTNKQTQEHTRLLGPWVAIDRRDAKARYLFPFWGHYESQTPTGKETGTYIFPTFFHQRNQDGYAIDTFFPLFWKSSGSFGRSLQIGPFFTRKTQQSYTQGLVPAYFYTQNAERSLLLTPLGYSHHNFKEQTASTWMALLFYRGSTATTHRSVLFPLWYAGHDKEKSHQVLFPLYWRFKDDVEKTSTTFAGPFFHRTNHTASTWGLAPLVWHTSDTQNKASRTALVPLFYRSKSTDHASLFTPLFGFGESPKSSWWYALPVVRRTSPESSFTAFAPLGFWHYNRSTETSTRLILPLLHFARSSPEKSLSSWLGVFWRHKGIASSTTVLFPLFFDHNSYHDTRTTALFPLFVRHYRDTDQTAYTLGPLFYRRSSPTESSTVLFPLYWDYASPGHRTQFLFPLFANIERSTWKGTYVFPNVWYRTGKGSSAGTSRLIVFPLWESEVKRPGDYMWEALLGLVGYERAGRNRFLKVLFIPFEMQAVPRTQTASWYGRPPKQKPSRAYGFSGHIW